MRSLNLNPAWKEEIEPAIRNHMKIITLMEGNWDGGLNRKIYRLFPKGSRDLLYKLALCDAQASIKDTGESQYESDKEKFDNLRQVLEEIDKINQSGFAPEDFQGDEDLAHLIADPNDQENAFALFLEYMRFTGFNPLRENEDKQSFIRQKLRQFPAQARIYLRKKYNLTQIAQDQGLDKKTAKKSIRNFLTEEKIGEYLDTRKTLNMREDFREWIIKQKQL
ncbi:MAG: hypothetical protein U5L10_00730 [Candidatus Moranbacteria bacterium]|nr:hypothetical protein [Candidatus Moranbacteria bacterium]